MYRDYSLVYKLTLFEKIPSARKNLEYVEIGMG